MAISELKLKEKEAWKLPSVHKVAICMCDHAMRDHKKLPETLRAKGPEWGKCEYPQICGCESFRFQTFVEA